MTERLNGTESFKNLNLLLGIYALTDDVLLLLLFNDFF